MLQMLIWHFLKKVFERFRFSKQIAEIAKGDILLLSISTMSPFASFLLAILFVKRDLTPFCLSECTQR